MSGGPLFLLPALSLLPRQTCRRSETAHIYSLVDPHQQFLLKSLLRHLEFVEQEVAQLDEEVANRMGSDKEAIRRLDDIPGVGRGVAEEVLRNAFSRSETLLRSILKARDARSEGSSVPLAMAYSMARPDTPKLLLATPLPATSGCVTIDFLSPSVRGWPTPSGK